MIILLLLIAAASQLVAGLLSIISGHSTDGWQWIAISSLTLLATTDIAHRHVERIAKLQASAPRGAPAHTDPVGKTWAPAPMPTVPPFEPGAASPKSDGSR